MTTTKLQADFYIAQNDTGPNLVAILTDEDGTPINLTGITGIVFRMRLPNTDTPVVDNSTNISVTDAANGEVTYSWQSGDTVTPGLYDGEIEVTFGTGEIISFPNYRYFTILVREEIS